MRLVRLEFDDEANPDLITAELTRDEALLIATVLGRMTSVEQEAALPNGGDAAGLSIYECLVGDVFNRYWDDGVKDALRERHA